jgi:hypothetical protein
MLTLFLGLCVGPMLLCCEEWEHPECVYEGVHVKSWTVGPAPPHKACWAERDPVHV